MDLKGKKILVTGGAGFLGSFLIEQLIKKGVKKKDLFIPRSHDLDLRKWQNCQRAVRGQDLVIHAAAQVGGIGFNKEKPAELFYNNLMMGTQLMEAAYQAKVKKFLSVGTICAYPKFTPVPFKEESLWEGYPEETNAPYGLAKKMGLVQSQAYQQQYGFNAIYLLLVNLYGPRDNFNPASSHVIPAIIHKIAQAQQAKQKEIVIWGSGEATREFLYANDAAMGIIRALERYDKAEPVNIGSGREISIKKLVTLIADIMKFKGKIIWDASKPDGQPRRQLDTARAERELGFKAKTTFERGLRATIVWYKQNEHKRSFKNHKK